MVNLRISQLVQNLILEIINFVKVLNFKFLVPKGKTCGVIHFRRDRQHSMQC
jgi:hypothetical protein